MKSARATHDEGPQMTAWQLSCEVRYDNVELGRFTEEMAPYLMSRFDKGEQKDYYNIDAYLLAQGAVTFRDGIRRIVINGDGTNFFTPLMNKIDQWQDWRTRKNFAQKKENQELQEMANTTAETMTV